MFELSQLRCFVAAAEELHFGRAAARLNMTQPPLSRQIQLLERILGVILLDRTSRSVRLTPAGRVFLLEARRILRLTESAALTTRQVATGEVGRIAIGFTAASGYGFLPWLLHLSRRHLSGLDITLREMVTDEQVEALITGRIDVGLLRPPLNRPEFDKMPVLAEPLVAALPKGDPRLDQATLTLADFDRKPMVMYAPEGAWYFHNMLVTMFDEANVKPHAVQHMSQIHSMLALVHAGLGAALVPEAATRLHFDDVFFRPVETTPARPVELYLTWRKNSDNPALKPLLDLVQAQLVPPEEEVASSDQSQPPPAHPTEADERREAS